MRTLLGPCTHIGSDAAKLRDPNSGECTGGSVVGDDLLSSSPWTHSWTRDIHKAVMGAEITTERYR